MKIKSIESVKFKGNVYNLELKSKSEYDDLFWVEGTSNIITHNCFPKDLQALVHIAGAAGLETNVLDAAWKTNNRVRMDRDWEKQEGRAIISLHKK